MKTNEYFDYLLYIGVILSENIEQIKGIIQNSKNDKKEEENLFLQNLMGDYLSSLDKDSLIKLGVNIYNQYSKNKSTAIGKHLSKMCNALQNLLLKKAKYCFNLWKNRFNSESKKNISKLSRSQSSDKFNKYYNNISINKYISYNNFNPKSQGNFLERMNKYNTKKENNKKFQQCLKEEEINFVCTFSPDLSLTKKNTTNFNKRFNKNKKLNSAENIKEEKPKRKVDNDRMMKLYNDFQQQKLKNEKLQENIDKENGITFSPKLNKDTKYDKKITDNFLERNKKTITNRKNFVEGFNLIRDLKMKGLDVNQIYIDFSKM